MLTQDRLNQIQAEFQDIRANKTYMKIVDIAEHFKISEAELIATQIDQGATRLTLEPVQMLSELPSLGTVMALTRNNSAVLEVTGQYGKTFFSGDMGLLVNPGDIDLRLFTQHWKSAFAYRFEAHGKTLNSIQFFDINGNSVHKIYSRDPANLQAYDDFVKRMAVSEQSPFLEVQPKEPKEQKQNNDVTAEDLKQEWSQLKDVHDIYILLKKLNLTRLQAIKLLSGEFSFPLAKKSIVELWEACRDKSLPFFTFIGNHGCIQIGLATAKNVVDRDGWHNILNSDFNIHLKESMIDTAWLVKKPTKDGILSSLELFSKDGENILISFGTREPSQPENPMWLEIIQKLSPLN